jgi:hypothetical protein
MNARLLNLAEVFLMAEDLHVVADLVADALNLSAHEVSSVLRTSPLIAAMPMVPASDGTTHKYPNYTGAPVVGFRAPNVGRDMDSSDDTLVTVTLKILDYSWMVDQAIANAWRRGAGKDDYIAREGLRSIAAALFVFEQQVIKGTIGASDSAGASGSSAGFAGFRDASTVDALADTAMVVNATGTTADTASSVYAVRIGDDGICGVYKGDGAPFETGDTVTAPKISSSTLTYPTYYTPGCTWLGCQVGGNYDIGRICNLTADSGKGLTDLLMADLLGKFPVGYGPTHFVMSRRSRTQLQKSRTTYSPTGAPAPMPTEYEGIPIIVSDAVSNTEEILA